MVGAWCFVDHYGPDDIAREPGHAGTAAPAHRPADGELAARGRGAAPRQPRQQADRTPARAGPDDLGPGHRALRGVARATTPAICTAPSCGSRCPTPTGTSRPPSSTTRELPEVTGGGGLHATVDPRRARRRPLARHASTPRIVGADLTLADGAAARLPLRARLRVRGPGDVRRGRGRRRPPRPRLDALPRLRPHATSRCARTTTARVMLLGGEPFEEKIVMWWNFVARIRRRDRRGPRRLAVGHGLRRGPRLRRRPPVGPRAAPDPPETAGTHALIRGARPRRGPPGTGRRRSPPARHHVGAGRRTGKPVSSRCRV